MQGLQLVGFPEQGFGQVEIDAVERLQALHDQEVRLFGHGAPGPDRSRGQHKGKEKQRFFKGHAVAERAAL